jgi:hypothetical protein
MFKYPLKPTIPMCFLLKNINERGIIMAYVDKEKVDYILALLKKLEFGSLVITVHGGQITQIDSTVKNRFGK